LNPVVNKKAALWWKQESEKLYRISDGWYGTKTIPNTSGVQQGSKGYITKILNFNDIARKSGKFDMLGSGVYTAFGTASTYNILKSMNLTHSQIMTQLGSGIVKDFVGMGVARSSPGGADVWRGKEPDIWVNAMNNGAQGMALTFTVNGLIKRAAPTLDPGKDIKRGQLGAAFTVNFSLATLKQAQAMGLFGGKPVDKPTNWGEWAHKNLPQAFAVGFGVALSMTPAARWRALRAGQQFGWGELRNETIKNFMFPAAQVTAAEFIINPPTARATSAPQPAAVNGGNKANARADIDSELTRGANPYQLADVNRDADGKYINRSSAVLDMASAVLRLQAARRETPDTPNVRTNAEAAKVIESAITPYSTNNLSKAQAMLVRQLYVQMDKYDMYFGSAAVKEAVQSEKAKGHLVYIGGSSKVDPAEKKFVREVFAGQIPRRRDQVERQDPLGKAVQTVLGLLAFLKVKGSGPTVVASEVLAPDSAGKGSDITPTHASGFELRIKNSFGSASQALGVRNVDLSKLPPSQRAQAEAILMRAMYLGVQRVVGSRPGSSTVHGTSNSPTANDGSGSYYFSAYMKMSSREKAAVKAECLELLKGAEGTLQQRLDRRESGYAQQQQAAEAAKQADEDRKRAAERAPTNIIGPKSQTSPSVEFWNKGPYQPTP
jgi:hypothetical protein